MCSPDLGPSVGRQATALLSEGPWALCEPSKERRTAGWEVGHENGFFNSTCCGWPVNSVGYVADPDGGGDSITIRSDGWGSLAEGIRTVEAAPASVLGTLTK